MASPVPAKVLIDPAGQIDDPHPMIRHIRDEQPRFRRVERQAVGLHEACLGRPARRSPPYWPDPSPASVVMTPAVSIIRTRRFRRSANKTRPVRSMTTP